MPVLELSSASKPSGLLINTTPPPEIFKPGNMITFGSYEVTMEDFLKAAHAVLTDTELIPEDPREVFIKSVKSVVIVKGRLEFLEPFDLK